MKILIVNGSVRDAQATTKVAKWVEKTAGSVLTDIEQETIALQELALPMFDEPVIPRANSNRQPEGNVKVWLDAVASAEGLVIVTPEYNHSMPSGLKNAIDYLDYQVEDKPFLMIGHGVNGAARSIENAKQALNSQLGGVPVPDGVMINGMVLFQELFNDEGDIVDESLKQQAQGRLEDRLKRLERFAVALKSVRKG